MAARRYTCFFAPLVLAALPLPPASAQAIARFVPVVPDGENVLALRHVREAAGRTEVQPWPASDAGWLFVREEGTQRNHERFIPRPGDSTLLPLECTGASAVLVGWDLPLRVESTTPAELRAFLAEHSAPALLAGALDALAPEKPVPVRRLESLALVAGRSSGAAPAEPSAIAISKSGQRMELRALMDPSFLAAGSDFAFKLYAPPGGMGGLHVRAVHLEDRAGGRATRAVERLEDGSLRTVLDLPGPWMLEAIRLRALEPESGAVLELASATLVFTVRSAEGGGR